MSSISLKRPRASVIIGALAVVLAFILAFVGYQLYNKFTNNTVVAYFPAANALYAGDRVEIMGVRVGSVDEIEPAGDKIYRHPTFFTLPDEVNHM